MEHQKMQNIGLIVLILYMIIITVIIIIPPKSGGKVKYVQVLKTPGTN